EQSPSESVRGRIDHPVRQPRLTCTQYRRSRTPGSNTDQEMTPSSKSSFTGSRKSGLDGCKISPSPARNGDTPCVMATHQVPGQGNPTRTVFANLHKKGKFLGAGPARPEIS